MVQQQPQFYPHPKHPDAQGYYAPEYQYPRAAEPSVGMTVVITLLFGVFGAIAAASATSRARQLGYTTNKYWQAFGVIFGCYLFLLIVVIGTSA